jgi:hypothetical protein
MAGAEVNPLRSPRHWAPRLALIAAAIALGLVLQQVLAQRLEAIQARSAHDMLAARAELAQLLRVVGGLVFGLTTAVGVALLASSRRALATSVFPPPGLWSWGSVRRVEGERARTLAMVSLVLAAVIVVCSLAGLGIVLYAANVLLACRAGA